VSDQEHNSEVDENSETVEETVTDTGAVEPQPEEAVVEPLLNAEEQIEALQQELVSTKDNALRMVAEAQNIKRRAEKDIDNARKYALEKFASELLAVADNMERALEASDSENEQLKPLTEGIELTQKSLLDILAKFNVEQLNPLGEPFDPQVHQAMSMIESPDAEPNSVTLVMQKGYTLNGRLLRPAMVMVAKAPAASE
jgi:molecular chaperone GrpE